MLHPQRIEDQPEDFLVDLFETFLEHCDALGPVHGLELSDRDQVAVRVGELPAEERDHLEVLHAR